jgi:hypothetical protein
MNSNYYNGKTAISYLAAKKIDVRKEQIAELDIYVQTRIEKGKKDLHFIKYWGASDKRFPDKCDLYALLHLFGFLRILERHYKMEVHLTIIFTDTHVMLNGYSSSDYINYFKGIRQILNEYNYNHVLMSDVLSAYIKSNNLNGVYGLNYSIFTNNLKHNIPELLKGNKSFELLIKSASKHSLRYSKKQLFDDFYFESAEHAAKAYIILNQIEKIYIEKVFSQSVLLTYTSDEENELIAPDLPIVQIYSYRKGIRSRPWFSKDEEEGRS